MEPSTLLIVVGVVGCYMLLDLLVTLAVSWREHLSRKKKERHSDDHALHG